MEKRRSASPRASATRRPPPIGPSFPRLLVSPPSVHLERLEKNPRVRVDVIARDSAKGTEAVIGRLHALQPRIPARAYADLVDVAAGATTHLGSLETFFERKDCVALVGKGNYGVGFRLCESSHSSASKSCSQCLLLKVVDTSSEKNGDPEDLFIEKDVHEDLSASLGGTSSVNGHRVKMCPHFPRLLQHIEQRPYLFLFMDLVRDYQIMRRAVKSMSAAQIKACMFQILYTLSVWQHAFADFRHNDLHMENVLITAAPPPAAYLCKFDEELHGFRLRAGSGSGSGSKALKGVQILDFGLASSAEHANHLAEDMDYKGYGTQRCDMYDVHTLLAELREPEYAALPQLRELFEASERWIPARFFAKGPLFLAKSQRLSPKGQAQLQRLDKGPLDVLLDDAYFAALRCDASAAKPQVGYDFS